MASIHREGFTRLTVGSGSDDQFSFNVIFVHGLGGHPRGTWEISPATGSESSSAHSIDATKKHKSSKSFFKSFLKRQGVTSPSTGTDQLQDSNISSKIFWPDQYLASNIPQARIWTYGYNADVIGGLFQANNKNSVSQHGRDLAVRLERDIEDEKPIVFVAHSLGGIIVKDAMHRSEKCRKRTKLIVFLGTPHRGSMYADWGQIAANLVRLTVQDANKKILETLEVNSEVLDNIHENFKNLVFKGGMKIYSFQEAKGITGIKGLDGKVVDDFSSKLDLPRELETVESIDANHMQMARYCSKDEYGYRAISGVLKGFVRQELDGKGISLTRPVDVSLPNVLFTVPFSRDDLFVGREDIITEISERRNQMRSHTRIALVGLGGVGKSQIAIEYAYRFRQVEPQTLIVWIHASNPARFKQGYRDIADKIPLPGREDPKADILQLLYAWLSDRRNGQWLMVLDNADDDGIFFAADEDTTGTAQMIDITSRMRPLESFLPQTPNGTILITSRNKIAAINLVGTHGSIIQVEPMDEKDALALLKTRVPFSQSDEADAKALVWALECIPLAITHAAAYIRTRAPTITMSSYLELFYKSEANQVHLLGKKGLQDLRRDRSIRHAAIATWQISFTQIQRTEQSAADLLALMSMFDRQGIPISLLQNSMNQLEFYDALAPLLSFSLVRAEIGKQSFEMHRLVQLSMRTWLEVDKQLSKWIKESLRVLVKVFPSGDYKTWPDCQVLVPHSKEVTGRLLGDQDDVWNQAKIASRTSWYLYLRGEYIAAEKVSRVAVEGREKVLGQEHPSTLNSISLLGTVLSGQGKDKEAEVIHRQALEGRERVLGQEHRSTLTSISKLGSVLLSQGKVKEAEVIHRQALEGRERVLGIEHPDTLTSIAHLASTFWKQARWKEAEELNVQVIDKRKRVLGEEHPDTLSSIAHLASTFWKQARWKEAEELNVQVIEARKKALGEKHPDTLTSKATLASTFWSQGRWKEAEELFIQVVETRKTVLGEDHPDTLTGMADLALTYSNQGRWKEAETLFVQVVETLKRVRGPEHPDTLSSIDNLGSSYGSQGRWNEAEGLFIQVIETRKKVLGLDHPDTLSSIDNLGSTYGSQGRWKEAEELELQVMQRRKSILGLEHPHTLCSLDNLASTYGNQGRWKEAEELELHVISTSLKVLGPEHPETLSSMTNLASTLWNQGRWDEAEELTLRVLGIRKRVLGLEHPDTLFSIYNLGLTYRSQGRLKEVEELEARGEIKGVVSPAFFEANRPV